MAQLPRELERSVRTPQGCPREPEEPVQQPGDGVRRDAGVRPQPEAHLAVAAGVEQRDRPFEVLQPEAGLAEERERGAEQEVPLDLDARILSLLSELEHLTSEVGRLVELAAVEVEAAEAAKHGELSRDRGRRPREREGTVVQLLD